MLEGTPLETARIEIPRWMFDVASCSRMPFETSPHVDCETLRDLRQLLEAQRAAWAAPMVQPQRSWQPGRGEADGTDHGPHSWQATGVVFKTTQPPALGESNRTDTRRGTGSAGAVDGTCSRRRTAKKISARGRRRS